MQTVGQRIMVECVECELALSKQNGNIDDYTKSSVKVLVFDFISCNLVNALALCGVNS